MLRNSINTNFRLRFGLGNSIDTYIKLKFMLCSREVLSLKLNVYLIELYPESYHVRNTNNEYKY